MAANKDHGFWPYLAPMFIFLGLVELGGRAPEAAAGVFLTLKVVVPLGLVVWFASRGRYPELRGYLVSARGVASDVGIGLLRLQRHRDGPVLPRSPETAASIYRRRGVGTARRNALPAPVLSGDL